MAPPSRYVLDSSAIIAWLAGEAGATEVGVRLNQSVVNSVALAESLTVLQRKGLAEIAAKQALRNMHVPVVDWTEAVVWAGADLCTLAWTHGLSFADRACLATARALGCIALTADAAWPQAVRSLRRPIRVQLIR